MGLEEELKNRLDDLDKKIEIYSLIRNAYRKKAEYLSQKGENSNLWLRKAWYNTLAVSAQRKSKRSGDKAISYRRDYSKLIYKMRRDILQMEGDTKTKKEVLDHISTLESLKPEKRLV